MSITFEIVKFKKPTKDDLSNLHMFNPYGSIPILDDDGDSTGWNIYMFRVDDKDIQNIINSSYAVKMELPECITDYDSFFEDLGFTKEVVRNGDVRIIKSNSRYITISYGDKSKEIEKSIPFSRFYQYISIKHFPRFLSNIKKGISAFASILLLTGTYS